MLGLFVWYLVPYIKIKRTDSLRHIIKKDNTRTDNDKGFGFQGFSLGPASYPCLDCENVLRQVPS